MANEQELPTRLALDEIGTWEQPSYSTNPDDEHWQHEGYAARDYNGVKYCESKDRQKVQQWLADNGYHITPDESHYQRSVQQ